MKEYINDIQNLIVKHWGKLIILSVLVNSCQRQPNPINYFTNFYS
jgi:hypothetical protein